MARMLRKRSRSRSTVRRRKRKPASKSLTKKIKAVVERNIETKCGFQTQTNSSWAETDLISFNNISKIEQGITNNTRIGNKVAVKGISIDATIKNLQSAWATYVRIWVVMNKTIPGTQDVATTSFIYKDEQDDQVTYANIVTSTDLINKVIYPFNKQWGTLLAERTIKLASASSANPGAVKRIKFFINKKFNINYDDAAVGPSNQDKYVHIIMTQWNASNAGTGTCFYHVAGRILFKDA